jgi:predicted dehydrogenase
MHGHRIGIIGTGGIARLHADGYGAVLGGLGSVVAGCDPDRGRLDSFCDRHDVDLRFSTAAELIASGEVDVIALLTPPAVRYEVIVPAAERGIHMLVEKPFGECLGDAISFVDAAEDGGARIAVNHELRFMADALRTHELVTSGAVGDVRFVAHDQFQNRTTVGGWRATERRLEISIFSIHLLDKMRWIVGQPPLSVVCPTRSWNAHVTGETFSALTVQFEGGAVGTMVSNWHSPRVPECRLRVDGDGGSILSTKRAIVDGDATLQVERADGRVETTTYRMQNAMAHTMGRSMRGLLEAVDMDVQPAHSGLDNLQTMAIVDAAYLSASRDGARVEIAEVWEHPAAVS